MDEAQWARIEAKRARQAHFRALDEAARKARLRGPVVIRVTVSKPKPKPKPPRQWARPIGPRPKPAPRPYVPKPREEWKPITGRPVTRLDNCLGCERPFRPRKTSIRDYPGTVYHVGKNLCRTCQKTGVAFVPNGA